MMTGPNDVSNSAIMDKLTTLTTSMEELKQEVGALKHDVGVLKQDVGVLKLTTNELTAVTQGIMAHMDRMEATTAAGFRRVDREFTSLRGEMNRRFDRVDVRLDALEAKRRRPKNRE